MSLGNRSLLMITGSQSFKRFSKKTRELIILIFFVHIVFHYLRFHLFRVLTKQKMLITKGGAFTISKFVGQVYEHMQVLKSTILTSKS